MSDWMDAWIDQPRTARWLSLTAADSTHRWKRDSRVPASEAALVGSDACLNLAQQDHPLGQSRLPSRVIPFRSLWPRGIRRGPFGRSGLPQWTGKCYFGLANSENHRNHPSVSLAQNRAKVRGNSCFPTEH